MRWTLVRILLLKFNQSYDGLGGKKHNMHVEFTSGWQIEIRHGYGRTMLKGINEIHFSVRLHRKS